MKKRSIQFCPKILGGFPPPVTGSSASLLAITQEVENIQGTHVERLDVSTGKITRNISTITTKFVCYIRHWFTLLTSPSKSSGTLYLISEGDKALVFTLLTTIIARFSGHTVILHHHSFSYINSHRFLMRATNFSLGKKDTHVFLSEGMASKFFRTYPLRRNFIVNHNLGQLEQFNQIAKAMPMSQKKCGGVLVIGMLSNLMKSKGLDTFISIAQGARELNLPIRFELAGPPVSEEDSNLIKDAKESLGDSFNHIGPVYGDDKVRFLKTLDIFIFPTRYHHEAQPIVLLEALCCGCAVISTDRGCIAEDMAQMGGISLDRKDASNPAAYLKVLSDFAANRKKLNDFRSRGVTLTQIRFDQAMRERRILIDRICALPNKKEFSDLEHS